METKELKIILEAALFMSPGTISVRELTKIARTRIPEVRVALNELTQDYKERKSALEIKEDSGGFRMAVRKKYEGDVMHLASSPQFHKGVMKTLAYIAFKQPVKQSDIIKFRNTKAYDHLALLKEKGFIKKKRSGITYIVRTTKRFQQHFGTKEKMQAAVDAAPDEPEEATQTPYQETPPQKQEPQPQETQQHQTQQKTLQTNEE